MEGRRRLRKRKQTLLPLKSSSYSNTISCYYCDFKIYVLNKPLFAFGQRYARLLKKWFAIGVGFSLSALIGVTVVGIWEFVRALLGYRQTDGIRSFWRVLVFGYSLGVSGLGISIGNFLYLCVSTLIAVTIHELGHALAAASEGIQMEYISIFLAVLFPGALVAFNMEILQAMRKSIALRIYCAGIWHNAVCCVVTALALLLLPLLLFPLYVHNENPVVISVSQRSPLSGYLSPGDVILYLDGVPIRNERDWVNTVAVLDEGLKQYSAFNSSDDFKSIKVYNRVKGYCIPRQLMDEGVKVFMSNATTACPDELTEFIEIGCNEPDDTSKKNYDEGRTCLAGKDVVELPKCGKAWVSDNISICPCAEEDICMSPTQFPGQAWIEISYYKRYMTNCSQEDENNPSLASHTKKMENNNKCGGTFVYIGDLISLAQSVHMSEYQPRWSFPFSFHFPAMLGKILVCTFYTSLALALLNSIPVYFLDGEAILEVLITQSPCLRPSKRPALLKVILIIGTAISTFVFLGGFISILT